MVTPSGHSEPSPRKDSFSGTSIVRSRLSIIRSHQPLTRVPHPVVIHPNSQIRFATLINIRSSSSENEPSRNLSLSQVNQPLHHLHLNKRQWFMSPQSETRRFSYTPYKRTLRCVKWR
jgi:hypothetical protein